MPTHFAAFVRATLVALVLAFAAHGANAYPTAATRSQTTAHTTTASEMPPADGVTAEGVLIIVGIVAAVIFFAWVCSRIGDNSRPTMM